MLRNFELCTTNILLFTLLSTFQKTQYFFNSEKKTLIKYDQAPGNKVLLIINKTWTEIKLVSFIILT